MAKKNGSAFYLEQANNQMSPLPNEPINRLVDNPYMTSLPEEYVWKPVDIDARLKEQRAKIKKAFKPGRI
jgi:hypothetical protein